MKVLHINTEIGWRGGEKQLALQLRYSSSDVENFLVCRESSAISKIADIPSSHLFNLQLAHGMDVGSAVNIRKLCKRLGIQIIHCHTPKALGIAVIAGLLGCACHIVTTKRTIFPIGRNILSRYKYRKADLVICVSRAVEAQVLRQLPTVRTLMIPSVVETIKPPSKIDLDTLLSIGTEKKIIGYVAALTREKNPEVFLQVAEEMVKRNGNAIFVWIGTGSLEAFVQEEIHKKGLSKSVFLVGFQKDIHQWIAALDILFFPSLAEGFPTTILDSFQVGTPVVASEVGGIPEMIQHGENGFLHHATDCEGFVQTIEALIQSKTLSTTISENAKKTAAAFQAPLVIPKIVDAYKKLTSS